MRIDTEWVIFAPKPDICPVCGAIHPFRIERPGQPVLYVHEAFLEALDLQFVDVTLVLVCIDHKEFPTPMRYYYEYNLFSTYPDD